MYPGAADDPVATLILVTGFAVELVAPGGGVPALSFRDRDSLGVPVGVDLPLALLKDFLGFSSALDSTVWESLGTGGNSDSAVVDNDGRPAVRGLVMFLILEEGGSKVKGMAAVEGIGTLMVSLRVVLRAGGGHSGRGGKDFSFSNSLEVGVYPLFELPLELFPPRNFCRNARIPTAGC